MDFDLNWVSPPLEGYCNLNMCSVLTTGLYHNKLDIYYISKILNNYLKKKKLQDSTKTIIIRKTKKYSLLR